MLRLLTFLAVLHLCPVSAQHTGLTSTGQFVRKGGTTALRYERPDSATAVQVTVANGTVTTSFSRNIMFSNGVRTETADSLYHWTMCDSPDSLEMAVATSYRDGVLLSQDTAWFLVVRDSIIPELTGPPERKGSAGAWMADEWTGVQAQRGFFHKTDGPEVVRFEVTITKHDKPVDHFLNVGGTLSPQHRARIRRHSTGEVRIHDIVFRHPCGVLLPARYPLRLRYAAPR